MVWKFLGYVNKLNTRLTEGSLLAYIQRMLAKFPFSLLLNSKMLTGKSQ